MVWSDESTDFTDLPSTDEVDTLLQPLKPHQPCISCGIKLRDEKREQLQHIPNGFTQYGLTYHVGDFIYIRPPENYGVLEIAQIMKVRGVPDNPSVSVRFFGRYDDSVPKQKSDEENSALLISDEVKSFDFMSGIVCPQHSLSASIIPTQPDNRNTF